MRRGFHVPYAQANEQRSQGVLDSLLSAARFRKKALRFH